MSEWTLTHLLEGARAVITAPRCLRHHRGISEERVVGRLQQSGPEPSTDSLHPILGGPVGVFVALELLDPLHMYPGTVREGLQGLIDDEHASARLEHAVGLLEGLP